MGNDVTTEKANRVWDVSLDGEDGSTSKYRLTANAEGRFEYMIEVVNGNEGFYEKITEYNGTYEITPDKKVWQEFNSRNSFKLHFFVDPLFLQ